MQALVEKLAQKHRVSPGEVEEVFHSNPRFRYVEAGKVTGEDLYAAMGRSDAGRYLIVFFIHKHSHEALVISARDMDARERRQHAKK